MIKNISVTDESGRDYGCTYPKRAKGLVKNGRARFVDENVICLACPPNQSQTNDLEEAPMSDIKETPVNPNVSLNNDPGSPPQSFDPRQSVPQQFIPTADGAPQLSPPTDISTDISVEYIMRQIESIHSDTAYLTKAIEKIGTYDVISGSADDHRADAIGNIVGAREETNRKILEFYTNLFYWHCPEAKPEVNSIDAITGPYLIQQKALEILGHADLSSENFVEALGKILGY